MHVAISLVSALPYTVNISTELFTATLISNVLLLCFLLSHCTDCSRNLANVVSSLFLDCVYLQCSSQMFTEKNEVYWDFFQGKFVIVLGKPQIINVIVEKHKKAFIGKSCKLDKSCRSVLHTYFIYIQTFAVYTLLSPFLCGH